MTVTTAVLEHDREQLRDALRARAAVSGLFYTMPADEEGALHLARFPAYLRRALSVHPPVQPGERVEIEVTHESLNCPSIAQALAECTCRAPRTVLWRDPEWGAP